MIRHKTKSLKKLNNNNALQCCADSSVGGMTGLCVGQSRDCALIPGRGKKCFSSQPSYLLSNNEGFLSGITEAGRESKDSIVPCIFYLQLCLVPRI